MPERRDLTLDLGACARSVGPDAVARVLLTCPGVARAHVDAYVTWALITFDPARATAGSIVAHLAGAGFDVGLTRLFDPDPATPGAASGPVPPPSPSTPPDAVQEPT